MVYTENKSPSGLDTKTTPINADMVIIGDSADSSRAKSLTFSNLKTWIESLTSYFNKTTAVLDDISNVNAPSPTDGDSLAWDNATQRWIASSASTPNGSVTVAGKFEEATTAETNAGTATGATGARLAVSAAGLFASNYATFLPSTTQKDALVGSGTPSSSNKYVTEDTLTTGLAAKATVADVQTFTGSGTYTKPSGAKKVFVQAWGAGGGGGRANTSADRGAGGGGGAYKEFWFDASAVSATETVTIGAGGAGGSATPQDGADGGNTTFGSLLTAYGGGGGQGANSAPVFGGGGGGSMAKGAVGGGAGSPGAPLAGEGASGAAGTAGEYSGGGGANTSAGGASHYGGGGGGGASNGAGGTSVFGGGGGAGNASGAATNGVQPAGGGGGSQGGNAGNGAAGKMIVTTFF